MGSSKRRTFKAKIRLSADLGEQIDKMVVDREMKLDTLLSELVQLGVQSLQYKPVPLEVRQHNDVTHTVHKP